MSERMKVLEQLASRAVRPKVTHACPNCQTMTYCAIDAGAPAQDCWCMFETSNRDGHDFYSGKCFCKACLLSEGVV
jgi:hypothetical protein